MESRRSQNSITNKLPDIPIMRGASDISLKSLEIAEAEFALQSPKSACGSALYEIMTIRLKVISETTISTEVGTRRLETVGRGQPEQNA